MPPRFPLPPEDLWPELHDRDSSLFAELLAAYFHDTSNALELAHATGREGTGEGIGRKGR